MIFFYISMFNASILLLLCFAIQFNMVVLRVLVISAEAEGIFNLYTQTQLSCSGTVMAIIH